MDRFDIIGTRTDRRTLYIDVCHPDTRRDERALTDALGELRSQTGARPTGGAPGSAQHYAFTQLLTDLLRFADEGPFLPNVSNADRQRRLRVLAKSTTERLDDIVHALRRRKVTTFSVPMPEDPDAWLKRFRAVLRRR